MKAGLAQHHGVAAVLPGGVEKLIGGAATDGHRADRLTWLAHHLQPLDGQELFQPLGKFPQGDLVGHPAPTARTLSLRLRQQRRDAVQAEALGQTLVDSFAGRIEGRVRTVDRYVGGNQLNSTRPTGVSSVTRLRARNGIG